MKFKTNLASLLLGAALGCAAMLTMAATSSSTLPFGRFQLVVSENYLFKIDTSTGKVWRTFTSSPSKEFMAPNIPTGEKEPEKEK
ncbi:MAG: hypothetical protein U1F65_05280 [Verrucomicrobiota bacterium]